MQARTHAKLTQPDLARKAGIAQSTIVKLESESQGSTAAVRLAMACGVRPEWLAEGVGEMVDREAWPFSVVTRAEILALDKPDLDMVEGAMLATLERIHSPNAEDVERFRNRHQKPPRKPARKRLA